MKSMAYSKYSWFPCPYWLYQQFSTASRYEFGLGLFSCCMVIGGRGSIELMGNQTPPTEAPWRNTGQHHSFPALLIKQTWSNIILFSGHLQHKAPTDQSNNFYNQQHIVCLPGTWFSQEECEKPYKEARLNFFYWISSEFMSTLKFYTLKNKSMTQSLLDFPILSLQSTWTRCPSASSATAGGSP